MDKEGSLGQKIPSHIAVLRTSILEKNTYFQGQYICHTRKGPDSLVLHKVVQRISLALGRMHTVSSLIIFR